MKPNDTINENETIEAVIGVFENSVAASRVAASLRGPEVMVQRVSRKDPTATNELPDIVFDDIEEVGTDDVTNGMVTGGAIGAGSGLLFLGIPGLNVAAPIAGMLAGAWIGGVAGIDEAQRRVRLPNEKDYQKMLADGKSFVVMSGSESERMEYATKMQELGATEVHQHPPVRQVVRDATN